jgi:hypothetical protein
VQVRREPEPVQVPAAPELEEGVDVGAVLATAEVGVATAAEVACFMLEKSLYVYMGELTARVTVTKLVPPHTTGAVLEVAATVSVGTGEEKAADAVLFEEVLELELEPVEVPRVDAATLFPA